MTVTLPWGKKSIEELKTYISPKLKKSNARILAVDDNAPNWADQVSGHGFHITVKKDLNSLTECTDFDVIVCDVRGVGQHLAAGGQGAYLASRIKIAFPDKYTILYTSGTLNASEQKYTRMVDEFLGRQTDLEGWVKSLEVAIEQTLSPYYRWRRARSGLLAEGMTLAQLIKLEDSYVRAVEKGRSDIFSRESVSSLDFKDTASIVGSVSSFLALFL